MINQIELTGRLFDSTLRYTKSQKAVVDTTLSFKASKDKEYYSAQVTFWGKNAEKVAKLPRATMVYVSGFLKQEKWMSKNETKRTKLCIVGRTFHVIDADKTFQNGVTKEKNKDGGTKTDDTLF